MIFLRNKFSKKYKAASKSSYQTYTQVEAKEVNNPQRPCKNCEKEKGYLETHSNLEDDPTTVLIAEDRKEKAGNSSTSECHSADKTDILLRCAIHIKLNYPVVQGKHVVVVYKPAQYIVSVANLLTCALN